MKTAIHRSLAALLLLLTAASVLAEDTAYAALRVVGAKHGDEALGRVIEIRGRTGDWRVVLADPKARGRVREVNVVENTITSESKSRKRKDAGTPINVALLNLDSDGVLATVDQQKGDGAASGVINCTLSNASGGTSPIWTVKLNGKGERTVSSIQIAADTGVVVEESVAPPSDAAQIADEGDAEKGKEKQTSSRSRSRNHDAGDVVHSIVKRVESVGNHLKRFLPFP